MVKVLMELFGNVKLRQPLGEIRVIYLPSGNVFECPMTVIRQALLQGYRNQSVRGCSPK